MPNIRFLYDNKASASAAAIVASSAATGLPAGAAVNPDRSYVWRSATGTGTPTLDIDLGSALAATGVAVANVRLVGTGVLEFYERGSAATAGAATLVGTLPTQDADTRVAFLFFSSQTKRHWQLKWTNPGAASDYAEAGYVFVGTYYEPTINVVVPLPVDRDDPSIGASSVDGQKTYATRTGFAVGQMEFGDVTETILDNLRTIFRTVGKRTPFFVTLDTTLAWTSWLLRLSSPWAVRFGEIAGRYHVSAAWEEVR